MQDRQETSNEKGYSSRFSYNPHRRAACYSARMHAEDSTGARSDNYTERNSHSRGNVCVDTDVTIDGNADNDADIDAANNIHRRANSDYETPGSAG